ncbi:hypothetical protein PORY_002707, partial [Pneumocystis oryctolagi]
FFSIRRSVSYKIRSIILAIVRTPLIIITVLVRNVPKCPRVSLSIIFIGRKRRWDVSEPSSEDLENKSSWSSTQDTPVIKKRSRWDQTPAPVIPVSVSDTATPKKSRWDQTFVIGITPIGLQGLQTPLPNMVPQMPISFGTDVSQRFYDFSDEELDEILPVKGFKVLDLPPGYAPIRTPVRKLMATPSLTSDGGFTMQEVDNVANKQLNAGLPTDIPGVGDLAFFKQEDMKYFVLFHIKYDQ